MSGIRRRYNEEFKKNAVKRSYEESKSVKIVSQELGIAEAMLYRWRKRYTPEGHKTKFAVLEEENKKLRFRLAELISQREILKKAVVMGAEHNGHEKE